MTKNVTPHMPVLTTLYGVHEEVGSLRRENGFYLNCPSKTLDSILPLVIHFLLDIQRISGNFR